MKHTSITLVTGGASGIGAACVKHLIHIGHAVVVMDLPSSASNCDPLAKGFVACDVTDESALKAALVHIENTHGPVSCLVNSAGILQHRLPPDQLSMQEWEQVLNVDFRGTYLCCSIFGHAMVQRKHGAIVNLASIAGMRSNPLHAYAPAKAAVISMTAGLAAEWGRTGVRVNAVSPGYTRTEALQAAIDRGDRDPKDLMTQAAMGRLVEPHEVAVAVAFLLSLEATAITGINLPVDAGWLAGSTWQTYGGVPPAQ
ncbi:MAG: 4-formylbenzenesulfonate dehydrogenase TsaC1/TsaC2 [Pseudomonadota bacterium]|jgi:NAD(P)-dependent dehydrogenase (short-subunit alcohol dehydrogenase family)